MSRPLKRYLPLILALGFGAWYFSSAPKEIEVWYRFGAERARVTALRIDLKSGDGSLLRHAEFRYPIEGAPAVQFHRLKLPKGWVGVEATIEQGEAARRVDRSFVVDEEGQAQVDLAP